jgi:hypothetical protein
MYGQKVQVTSLMADSRYDPQSASIYLRSFKIGTAKTYPVEGAGMGISGAVKSGEWFYVHYYVDVPGNGSIFAWDSGTVTGQGHIEDTGNRGNPPMGTTTDFSQYWYLGTMSWTVKFDPAIIQINANDGSGGSGINKFTTVGGTVMRNITDPNGTADGHNTAVDVMTTSNAMGMANWGTANFAALAGGPYPGRGNGVDGGPGVGVDWDVAYISLRAKTGLTAGQGSSIRIAYDSHTTLTAYRTESSAYNTLGDWGYTLLKSTNWPNWCELISRGVCDTGQYNAERISICIQ